MDESYNTNEPSFLMPSSRETRNISDKNKFLSELYAEKGFSGNLLKLQPLMFSHTMKPSAPPLKITYVKPKRNPFEFKQLFNDVHKLINTQKVGEQKVELPQLNKTEPIRCFGVPTKIKTTHIPQKPTKKISLEGLCQQVIEFNKVRDTSWVDCLTFFNRNGLRTFT